MIELETQGVVLINEFLPIAVADKLRRVADSFFATIIDEPKSPRVTKESLLVSQLKRDIGSWGGIQLDLAQGLISSVNFVTVHEAINARVRELFGQEWQPALHKSFFRRLPATGVTVPWHIDIEAASTASVGKRCINVWMPFTPVGKTAPGLEFILGSHHLTMAAPLAVDAATQHAPAHRDDAAVAAMPGERWTPELKLGDALVFDEYMLHRTQKLAGARTSCEMRFAIPGERLPWN